MEDDYVEVELVYVDDKQYSGLLTEDDYDDYKHCKFGLSQRTEEALANGYDNSASRSSTGWS